jgi:hypothetical protein
MAGEKAYRKGYEGGRDIIRWLIHGGQSRVANASARPTPDTEQA